MTKDVKFIIPAARFDADLAGDGAEFECSDENGADYGTFKLRLMDGTNPRWKVALERYSRNFKPLREKEKENMRQFAHCAVIDWNLKDEDGKKLDCTPELVVQYFQAVPYAYQECFLWAYNVDNFVKADLGN